MSATLNCCNSCATVETVNIPGSEGSPGTDGENGVNAYTTLTGPLTVPAEGDPHTFSVDSSVWMVIGQIVIVGEGLNFTGTANGWAHFRVTAIPTATSVTLDYLNYDGDQFAGEILPTGYTVSPAGVVGPAGP